MDVLPGGWSDGAGPCLRGRYRRTTRLTLLDPTARLVGRRLEPDRWESRARTDFDFADFRREHDLPLVSASSSASLAKATSPDASFYRACKRRILRVPVLGWFVRRVCPRTSRGAEPSGTHASVSRAPLEQRPFDRREARSFGDPARIRRLFAQPSNSRHSGERPACRAARSPRTSPETLSEKRSRVVPFAFCGRRPSSRSGGVVRPFRVPSSLRTRVRRASAFAVARARPCRFCHVFPPREHDLNASMLRPARARPSARDARQPRMTNGAGVSSFAGRSRSSMLHTFACRRRVERTSTRAPRVASRCTDSGRRPRRMRASILSAEARTHASRPVDRTSREPVRREASRAPCAAPNRGRASGRDGARAASPKRSRAHPILIGSPLVGRPAKGGLEHVPEVPSIERGLDCPADPETRGPCHRECLLDRWGTPAMCVAATLRRLDFGEPVPSGMTGSSRTPKRSTCSTSALVMRAA